MSSCTKQDEPNHDSGNEEAKSDHSPSLRCSVACSMFPVAFYLVNQTPHGFSMCDRRDVVTYPLVLLSDQMTILDIVIGQM